MSGLLTRNEAPTTAPAPAWRPALPFAPAGLALLFALVTPLYGVAVELVGLVVGMGAAAIAAHRLRPRRAAGVVLFVALGAPAANGVFLAASLPHPESPLDFGTAYAAIVLCLLGLVSATGTLAWWPAPAPGAVLAGTAATLAAGVVASLLASLAVHDDPAQPGDVIVQADDVAWDREVIELPPEADAVLVRNRDLVRHTFTIDELGIDRELPAGTDRRIVIDAAPPGTYEVVCDVPGHDAMRAVLVVAPAVSS